MFDLYVDFDNSMSFLFSWNPVKNPGNGLICPIVSFILDPVFKLYL